MKNNLRHIDPYIPSERGIRGVVTRLKLDWNEGFADIKPLLNRAISKVLENPSELSQYVEPNYAGLMDAANDFYLKDVKSVVCLPFPGSDAAIAAVAGAFISPGDVVGIPVPSYDNARLDFEARLAHIERYRVDITSGFNVENFIEWCQKISPSLIYLVNPCNPMGYILDDSKLKLIADSFPSTILLIDEAYIEFSGHKSSIGLIAECPNIIVTRTLSKAFSLASARVGFLFGSSEAMSIVNKIRNSKAIALFSNLLAIDALSSPGYMNDYVVRVVKQRNDIESYFKELGVVFNNSFGNFIIFRDSGLLLNRLKNSGILYRDRAKDFGEAGWVRLTLCPDEPLIEVLRGS